MENVEVRTLSTGETLVFCEKTDRMIVIEPGGRIDSADAWGAARALVTAGAAREFSGNQIQHVSQSLCVVRLLMPDPFPRSPHVS